MITHIIFNLKFSMDVSSINITARMCSQAMLIQFPRSAPLSAPVALYTPFKFCTFLFFVTKSRIFGPNTSGVENTPNFLSFNVIRNPALLDTGRWTLDVEHFVLDIGHWTWGIGDETMDMSHWHWTLDIGNLPLLDGSCLPLDPLQGGKPPPSVPAALPAIIILTYLNVAQPLHSRCTTFPQSLHNLWIVSVKFLLSPLKIVQLADEVKTLDLLLRDCSVCDPPSETAANLIESSTKSFLLGVCINPALDPNYI